MKILSRKELDCLSFNRLKKYRSKFKEFYYRGIQHEDDCEQCEEEGECQSSREADEFHDKYFPIRQMINEVFWHKKGKIK